MSDMNATLGHKHRTELYVRSVDDFWAEQGKTRMTAAQREAFGLQIREILEGRGHTAEPSTSELLNRLVELNHTVQDLSKLIIAEKDSNSAHLSRLEDLRRVQTTVVKNVRTGNLQTLRTCVELSRLVEESKVQIMEENAIHNKQMAAAQKDNEQAYKKIFEDHELLSEQCAALANASNDTRVKNQMVSAALIGFVTGACIAGAANRGDRKMKLCL